MIRSMALSDNVPTVTRSPIGILALILNIVLPGIGTIVAGVIAKESMVRDIIIGVLQLVLSGLLIGWIWSVIWGVLIFQKSS
jgi:hypothetical protein